MIANKLFPLTLCSILLGTLHIFAGEFPDDWTWDDKPEVRAAHAALSGRGAEFINAPHMIHRHEDGTEEWMAFFKDNDGRPLGIMSQAKS